MPNERDGGEKIERNDSNKNYDLKFGKWHRVERKEDEMWGIEMMREVKRKRNFRLQFLYLEHNFEDISTRVSSEKSMREKFNYMNLHFSMYSN